MNTRQAILVSVAIFLVCVLGAWWYLGFSLDVMQFFASEPAANDVTTSPQASPTTQSLAGVVTCAPSAQSVAVGAAARLVASGGDGSYEWFAPTGTPSTGSGASFSVTYATAGTKKVTVQSARRGTTGNIDSVQCSVIVTP